MFIWDEVDSKGVDDIVGGLGPGYQFEVCVFGLEAEMNSTGGGSNTPTTTIMFDSIVKEELAQTGDYTDFRLFCGKGPLVADDWNVRHDRQSKREYNDWCSPDRCSKSSAFPAREPRFHVGILGFWLLGSAAQPSAQKRDSKL